MNRFSSKDERDRLEGVHRVRWLVLITAVAVASTAACGRAEPDAVAAETSAAAGAAIPVVTAVAAVKTMPVTVDAVGTVEAIATVEVRAQVTGQIERILFAPGQAVKKGEPLFALDARPFTAALKQAEAVAARDRAQADDAKAQRTRLQNLFNRGIVPRDQLETQSASATALEATLAADLAQVEQARLNLQYTRIAAPITGRTGALLAHVGDLVKANDTNPLVTINQLSPIYVSFAVPGRMLTDIRRQESRGPLPVRTKGDVAAEGKVTFIDNAVDPTTATINLKATFPNTDSQLWPGLFVPVAMDLSAQPNAIVVPAIAVQPSQQGPYVYVVKNDRTVEMRRVEVDRQQGDETIIARGLAGGEEVVTEGQLRLRPGVAVTTESGGAPVS
jgi:multidrug efflux system membrane fusion protein